MKTFRLAIIYLIALPLLVTAAGERDSIRLKVTYPPSETETEFPQIRIAGSCSSSCELFVEGKRTKVYPSGAFVSLVKLKEGENSIEIIARKGRETRRKLLRVVCRDPLVTSPVSPLTTEDRMMKPSADTVLQTGDKLQLQIKGSPGMKAYWSLGNIVRNSRMKEKRPAKSGIMKGIAGIYTATYRIKAGDSVEKEKVKFKLASRDGREVEASSSGLVTLLPAERISPALVGGEGAVVSAEPGGSRIWKLKPEARVNLCGESGDYYRLKLSDSERFWIPKKSVKHARGRGAWKVAKAGQPRVSLSTDGAMMFLPICGEPPLRLNQLPEKRMLKLDIFGTSGDEKVTKSKDGAPIRSVQVAEAKDGLLDVKLLLEGRQPWGYKCWRTDKGIGVDVRRKPGKKLNRLMIVIDPGHGGRQLGAVSPTGLLEKDANLDIARQVANFLKRKGARVALTRDKDIGLSLRERIDIARRKGADIFVSIHNNSIPGHSDPLKRRGSDVYLAVPQSETLAESILKRLSKTGLRSNACHRKNFAVVLPTDYIAVLVECAFMSHPEDEALLLRKSFRRKIAKAISRGIVNFVKKYG